MEWRKVAASEVGWGIRPSWQPGKTGTFRRSEMSRENACRVCHEEFASSLGLAEHKCDPIDRVKPTLKEGETLCDGCWAVAVKPANWIFIKFKYLKSTWLCENCRGQYQEEFEAKQRAGL